MSVHSERIENLEQNIVCGPASAVPLSKATVGCFLHEVLLGASENSKAMIDGVTNQTLFHAELLQKAVNLAQSLRYHGYYGKGTILSIHSENSINYFVPVLAAFFNGSIIAPLNPSYTIDELEHVLQISRPSLVFCSKKCAQKIYDLKCQKLNYIQKVLVLGNVPKKKTSKNVSQSMDFFINKTLEGKNINVNEFKPMDGDSSMMPALILCSSGTTGLPKGVVLSHLNIMTRLIHGRDPRYYSQDTTSSILGLLPFFHAYGLTAVLSCIANLQTIICLERFDEDIYLKTIETYKINTLTIVPPLAIFLANSKKVLKYDLSSVKNVICSAAPLNKWTEEMVRARLKQPMFRQCLGMTETTSSVTFSKFGEYKNGSCGKLMPFMSGKVVDLENGSSLGPNNIGHLYWKGLLVMMGYHQNREATKETLTEDGWLKSGDLGYYDEDGFFYIVDRIKEVIKYKGYQVAPAELEGIIINHQDIDDVGVVGIPDELAGELPIAFVVKKKGRNVTAEEIIQYVADKVSSQKRLRGGVIFVESIPKNPSGKILRKKLRERLNCPKAKL